MDPGAYGKKAGIISPGATMISASLPIFVDYSKNEIIHNVTFTAVEWANIVAGVNKAQSDAMTVGIIIGFVVGIFAISAGMWWRNRGN